MIAVRWGTISCVQKNVRSFAPALHFCTLRQLLAMISFFNTSCSNVQGSVPQNGGNKQQLRAFGKVFHILSADHVRIYLRLSLIVFRK